NLFGELVRSVLCPDGADRREAEDCRRRNHASHVRSCSKWRGPAQAGTQPVGSVCGWSGLNRTDERVYRADDDAKMNGHRGIFFLAMRVLLVEDEPNAARVLAKGLREETYAVDLAADGEAAVFQVG